MHALPSSVTRTRLPSATATSPEGLLGTPITSQAKSRLSTRTGVKKEEEEEEIEVQEVGPIPYDRVRG